MTNGLVVMTPSSIAYSGTSASINADGSVVFSACTSLSLNGVFTGDYDNYMTTIRFDTANSGTAIDVRLRSSGVDNDTANSYVHQYIFYQNTAPNAARATTNKVPFFAGTNTTKHGGTGFFFGPYLSQPTAGRSVLIYGLAGASLLDYAFTHNQTASYDGFTLFCGSAFTGLVTVFGFAQ